MLPEYTSLKVIDDRTIYEVSLDPVGKDQNLGKIEVSSLEQLKDSKPDVKKYINPNKPDSKKFYKAGLLKATFTPPNLVKELDLVNIVKGYPIVLGKKDKRKYLPISDWNDLEAAREIAEKENARLVFERTEKMGEIEKEDRGNERKEIRGRGN